MQWNLQLSKHINTGLSAGGLQSKTYRKIKPLYFLRIFFFNFWNFIDILLYCWYLSLCSLNLLLGYLSAFKILWNKILLRSLNLLLGYCNQWCWKSKHPAGRYLFFEYTLEYLPKPRINNQKLGIYILYCKKNHSFQTFFEITGYSALNMMAALC